MIEGKLKRVRWRRNFLLAVMISCLAVSLGVFFLTENYLWRVQANNNNSVPRALIADQLALNYPDPSFLGNLTSALVGAGYHVDYWGPSPNAVEQFRGLPSAGYDLIIIRSHTGSSQSIITTQPYSRSEYPTEQLSGALVPAVVGDGSVYFAFTSRFIRLDMAGRFSQSTVVIMGCASLQGSQDLATSFLDKGANFFVGWAGTVTIIHTDTSTVAFARQLSRGMSVPEATRTAGDADPVFGSNLQYLDWNGLVHSRINDLGAKASVWLALASILILGPLAIFIAPKIMNLLENTAGRMSSRKKKGRPNTGRS